MNSRATIRITATNGAVGIPRIPPTVRMAANSVVIVPKLATKRPPKIRTATRAPCFSRIRSASPRRVTRVKRMPISWVIASRGVTRKSRNRTGYPRVAPATEYVATPPASLSAIAAIVPGPNTDRISAIRRNQRLLRQLARTPSRGFVMRESQRSEAGASSMPSG